MLARDWVRRKRLLQRFASALARAGGLAASGVEREHVAELAFSAQRDDAKMFQGLGLRRGLGQLSRY